MQLDLSPDEAALLADVLESALGETREEVYKAEVADYKAALKNRESLIANLLSRLRAGRVVT
jgi:hypothetical protein